MATVRPTGNESFPEVGDGKRSFLRGCLRAAVPPGKYRARADSDVAARWVLRRPAAL